MAKRTEINPVSGERVKKLLQKNRITQEVLSERLGITVQHMSQIVTGNKRLTETNARKIAEMFPPVRMEYLMGWDDFETEEDVRVHKIEIESMDIFHDSYMFMVREQQLKSMLKILEYSIYPTEYSEEEKQSEEDGEELYQFLKTIRSDKKVFTDYFTVDGWKEMQKLCNARAVSDISGDHEPTLNMFRDRMGEKPELWLIECSYLNKRFQEDLDKGMYTLYNKAGETEAQFTAREIEKIAEELCDVVTALIQYHITKKKGQA